MFTEIGIENFKAFGKMQRIPLKPITLLYGPNSSGKSSLLQALLMFKQTLDESHNKDIVLLPKGSLVDLGGYTEFINGHNKNKNFTFGITMNCENYPDDPNRSDWEKIYSHRYTEDPIALEFTFQQEKTGETSVSSISVADKLGAEPIASYVDILSIPKLKKIIMGEKRADSQHDKDIAQRNWIAELKRSVLVCKSIRLDGPLSSPLDIGSRWENLDRHIEETEEKIEKGKLSREVGFCEYISLSPQKIRQDLDVLKRIALVYKDVWERLVQERTEQGHLIENWRMEEIKHEHRLRDLLSDIKEVPFDRLVLLKHCFPMDLMSGKEKCFKNIGKFEFYGATFLDYRFESYMDSLPTNLVLYAGWMFTRFLRDMIYIGPLRALPERLYSYSGNIPSDVGPSGRYMPDILAGRPEIVEKVNSWFERMEIGYDIDIRPASRNHFEIVLTDRKTGWETNPKDVGFGISQLMPIIVQGVISQNKTICIEQPEIHVHPRLQAELGSFFAECLARVPQKIQDHTLSPAESDISVLELLERVPQNEDISPRYNQFIIETHSEHLVLRLLRLIRDTTNGELKEGENPLRPEDVAVIYAKPTEHGTELMELRISEDGDFIDKCLGSGLRE
jgi:hypothetical protein